MALPPPLHRPLNAPAIPVSRGSNRISQQLAATTIPDNIAAEPVVFTETHQLQVIVPAGVGSPLMVNLAGISFYFPTISITTGINARFIRRGSPGPIVQYFQGTGLRVGTRGFDKVELINTNAAAATVNIVVGGGIPNNSYDEFIDKRVIIVNNPASNVFIQTGPTFSVGFTKRSPGWADSLNAGATQVVADGYNGKSRKSIIFSNDDAGAVLTVLDVDGNIMGSVQPSTAWTTDTGGSISLHNPTANPVTCHIGEVYYS